MSADTWTKLAEHERAESPDGMTGMDRLMARRPRLQLTLTHEGQVRMKSCDNCLGTREEIADTLITLAASIRAGEGQ